MFKDDEIKYDLIKVKEKMRIIRITHIPSGIYVEDNKLFLKPLVFRKERLLKELESLVEKRQNI